MNDITKLPQWAQRKFELLQAEVKHLEEQLAMAIGDVPSNISTHFPAGVIPHEKPRFLRDWDSVYFRFGKFHLQVRYDEKQGISVNSSSGRLLVQPDSYNHVHLIPRYTETPAQHDYVE